MRQHDLASELGGPVAAIESASNFGQVLSNASFGKGASSSMMSYYQSNQGYGGGWSQQYQSGWRATIAVDLDDVLCATNAMVAQMHNETYGTDFALEDFQHYIWWKNRGWGTAQETVDKVKYFYNCGLFSQVYPVSGAVDACLELRRRGYNLVIITARPETRRGETERWLAQHVPHDLFSAIWFTGAYAHLGNSLSSANLAAHAANTKADAMRHAGATILIDDSLENALDIAHDPHPPGHVLLFGGDDCPWNRRESRAVSQEDMLCYEERQQRGMYDEGYGPLPNGITRVEGWYEVLQALQ